MINYIRNVVNNCSEVSFLHLNPQIYLQYKLNPGHNNVRFPDLEEGLANRGHTVDICSYCCAQFAVSKETIRRHSIRFYCTLLKYSQEDNDCSFLEHTWHIIFASTLLRNRK